MPNHRTIQFIAILSLGILTVSPLAKGQSIPKLQVGDVLSPDDLRRPRFGSDLPLNLAEFKGKILYLEWFYWW